MHEGIASACTLSLILQADTSKTTAQSRHACGVQQQRIMTPPAESITWLQRPAWCLFQIEVGRDRIAQWPGPRQLTVLAEQATLFYDVMTEGMVNQASAKQGGSGLYPRTMRHLFRRHKLDWVMSSRHVCWAPVVACLVKAEDEINALHCHRAQVFGQAAWEAGDMRRYFRFLHFTTEDARAASPRVLRFSFNLPPMGKVGPPAARHTTASSTGQQAHPAPGLLGGQCSSRVEATRTTAAVL
jgi:hypothetical protein